MKTGYEVTFADFQQLLFYAPYREEVAPLLREWFAYEVVPTGDGARVLDRSGAEISLASAHATTQADPARQADLYRVAMTLWH